LKVKQRLGFVLILVVSLGLLVSGCVSRGVSNPGWTVLAINQDIAYAVLNTGKVVALDAASGSEKWVYPIAQASGGLFRRQPAGDPPLNAVYGVPVFTDELVLAGTYDNKVVAFVQATGLKAWEYVAQGSVMGGMVVDGEQVYLGGSDGRVYALKTSAAGAELLWSTQAAKHAIWGVPVLTDDLVIVGSLDHYVYALKRADGELVWDHDMGAAVAGDITLADDLVLVGGVANKLTALEIASGDVVWESQFKQWVWGEAFLDGGVVYVSSLDGQLHALDPRTGETKWDTVLQGAARSGPALAGDYLVIGTAEGNIYRVEKATGKAELLYKSAGRILSRPAVSGNRVLVGTDSGQILALDTTVVGGAPVWQYPAVTK